MFDVPSVLHYKYLFLGHLVLPNGVSSLKCSSGFYLHNLENVLHVLSKNLSGYIIILHMSCRNSLTNRYTKQTFGKRLTCNMLSIGMIIQKNRQCVIPSSSKASALVLASFDHSCIKVDRVGTFSFMHTEVFSSAKKDDMKYCSMFFSCICLNVMKYLFFQLARNIISFQSKPLHSCQRCS